jgi:hypothetical protein
VRRWLPGLVPGCIPTQRPPEKSRVGAGWEPWQGGEPGTHVLIMLAMEDSPPVDEPQHDGLGRVHVVAASWRAVEGVEGRRLAGRLAEVLMHEPYDLAAADWPRPGG